MNRNLILVVIALVAASSQAQNLFTNPGFEAGNVGFQSEYTYTNPGNDQGGLGNMEGPGLYTIDDNLNNSHSSWSNVPLTRVRKCSS